MNHSSLSDCVDATLGDGCCPDPVEVFRAIQRLTGLYLRQVAAVADAQSFPGAGAGVKVTAWMSSSTGMSPRTAGGMLATARKLQAHAQDTLDALTAGQVTAEAARTIGNTCAQVAEYEAAVRVVEPERVFRTIDDTPYEPVPLAQEHLLALAKDKSLHQANVAAAARKFTAYLRPESEEAAQKLREELRSFEVDALPDGRWMIRGVLTEVLGLRLKTLLDAATPRPDAEDTRTASQRRHDAFGDLIELTARLADEDSPMPTTGQRSPHVRLTVSADTLTAAQDGRLPVREARDWLHVGVETDFGTHLSRAGVRELACSPTARALLMTMTGDILKAGHSRRFPTDAQRDAIIARDQHCRYPGCDRSPRWLDIHHRIPWHAGGPTDVDNMVAICSRHHHQIETQGLTLLRDKQGREDLTKLADALASFATTPRPRPEPPRPPGPWNTEQIAS
jgi:hypothetical protein